jgi:hypothetical protein
MRWLLFASILLIAMLAHAVARDAHADEARCPEDLNGDTYLDILDIAIEAGHYNEAVVPGSPYDLAPLPRDGYVDVIHDLTHLAGIFGQACNGANGETSGTAQITSGNESMSVLNISWLCYWGHGMRSLHPYVTNYVNVRYAMEVWCYQGGDPLALSSTCIAQIQQQDPGSDWYLIASGSGQTEFGEWCHAEGLSAVPRWKMLRIRAAWQVRQNGQLVIDDARGEEFAWMLN